MPAELNCTPPWRLAVILPLGVTGYRDVRQPPLAKTDFAAFRAICFAAVRTAGDAVISSNPPTHPSSFGSIAVELADRRFEILINSVHPIVGFTENSTEAGPNLTFIDQPELAMSLKNAGPWWVLSAAELNHEVEPESLLALTPAELRQISHWKPERHGEIIFNRWD